MESKPVTIGTRIWLFDSNRRVYTKPEKGFGKIIYEHHFIPYYIVGETKGTWLVDHDVDAAKRYGDRLEELCTYKVNKKTMRTRKMRDYDGHPFFTDEERADDIWIENNRRRLCEWIGSIRNVPLLKEIAKLTNFEEYTPPPDALKLD